MTSAKATALYSTVFLACAWVLSNGNVSNSAFILLLAVSAYCSRETWKRVELIPFPLLFASPICAVAVGQALRLDLNLSEFDAPLRILLALIVFYTIRSWEPLKQKLMLTVSIGSAAGLILVILSLDPQWMSHYGGRFATTKSAPNDLGGYSGLLLIITVLGLLTPSLARRPLLRVGYLGLLLAGLTAGIYVLFGTQSRGPWLVTAIVLLMVLSWTLYRQPRNTLLLSLVLATGVGVWTQTQSFQTHKERIYSTLNEPLRWATKNEQATSGGARLSMLPASKELFLTEPLRGFGDFGYSPFARTPEFATKYGPEVANQLGGQGGPHNEIAARSLQSGIWGLLATVFLLVYPVYRFGRQTLEAKDENQRDLSFMGFIVFTYIFLLSFVLEPYSLKHTATFNALLLAVLLGATAEQSPNFVSIGTTSASDRMEPDRTRA